MGSREEQELVAEELGDGGKLPRVLNFQAESPPVWDWKPVADREQPDPEEVEVLRHEDFLEEYSMAYADAKTRLTGLIVGFEGEKREALQRQEQLGFSSESLRFHLERMERFQTSGLTRPRLIRELERGLVALDAAEGELEVELSRLGQRKIRLASEPRLPVVQEWLLHGKSFAMLQILAFFLPLLIFGIIALILIGTALGWF